MQAQTVLDWSGNQDHILTGGGELLTRSSLGIEYEESDLPHFHLRHRNTRKQFAEWLSSDARSNLICGCWYRPVFAGGWRRDSDKETDAFNLQTPSLFIDMRFPVDQATRERLRSRGSLTKCSAEELQLFARQHCFAGYSLPSTGSRKRSQGLDASWPHFTRHHAIDWNYHPSFPRPRPNKWWVLLSSDQNSFKEYSFARDAQQVPIYFEQWNRRAGDSHGRKYLAARRETECPLVSAAQGRPSQRDAFLIIVGNHFALAVDRAQPLPAFQGLSGPAGPALVDQILAEALPILAGDSHASVAARPYLTEHAGEAFADCVAYLDLEGSYGLVRPTLQVDDVAIDGTKLDTASLPATSFLIVKSTHPWKEGQTLGELAAADVVVDAATGAATALGWGGYKWTLQENSFSLIELRGMFGARARL